MDSSLFFSVGEPSGDLHASNLITQLRSLDSGLQFRGLGGSRMAANGCQIDYELTQLAVMGMFEVLPKLREFFRVADLAEVILRRERPAAVVLVDFPGFNWHIAKRAHRLGIPVIYYLPPQLWAWGAWRLKKLKRTVSRVLCNLPFEPAWYAARDVQVDYVGHPFFDLVHTQSLDREFLQHRKSLEGLQVAVLPGSRSREVEHIWPMQLQAIRTVTARYPQTRFLVAAYRENQRRFCQQSLTSADSQLNIEFFVDKTSEIIELCDCALIKSGSVSLELMARGKPTVVTYHASRTFYAIGRRLTNLNSMTLPNMIAGETVMPEFLAVGSTAKATAQVIDAMDRLIGDDGARAQQSQKLRALASRFAQPGASARAATLILETIRRPTLNATAA
jgi:lipid-A-disaccharide synthase